MKRSSRGLRKCFGVLRRGRKDGVIEGEEWRRRNRRSKGFVMCLSAWKREELKETKEEETR